MGVAPGLQDVKRRIFTIRGRRVMLDCDLAAVYGVSTKRMNQAVRRNPGRFPADFMFQLAPAESRALRSQFVTSNGTRGGRRYLPYAFTEHGAVMLASVLNSPRAISASVLIVRAFVALRRMMAGRLALGRKLGELESKVDKHDVEIREIIGAIQRLINPPAERRRRIGFRP